MKKKATIIIENNTEKLQEKVIIEIKNNKLNYQENKSTDVLFDLDKQILIRENKELYMELLFKEEKGNIYIKNLKKHLELLFKTKKIDITKNKIVVQYEMEQSTYLYKVEMED